MNGVDIRHEPVRILCVDDHPLMRAGIVRIVTLHADLTIVAEASTGEEAMDAFVRHRPDITLMDLRLPGMDGLEAIRRIRQVSPEARIVVLTMYDTDADIVEALRAGAVAYLLKDALPDTLVQAIYDVRDGKPCIARDLKVKLETHAKQPTLSLRETQIIQLLAKGMRNKEIAARLGISEQTVRVHVKSTFLKLNVHDRTAAMAEAFKRGIIRMN